MNLGRLLRHLIVPPWWAARQFPARAQAVVGRAIAESETRHRGELRFVVEGGMPIGALRAGQNARQRAVDLFASLGVWDTADNSGVLIYVQLADRRVEIVADRGIDARVGQAFWAGVCRDLEAAFRAGRFEAGAVAAIETITGALVMHFPPRADNPNELPDQPLVL